MVRRLSLLLVIAALQVSATTTNATTLDFSSIMDATVEFTGTGDTFQFVSDETNGFDITSSDGAAGDAAGLLGRIEGTFTIGAIDDEDGLETAPVTGAGMLVIDDGSGSSFTADLNWLDIATFGGVGGMNTAGAFNLSNFSYGGSNADLQQLAALPAGGVTTTFQFIPTRTLTELTTDGTNHSTSYSGTIFAVPEPASMVVCGIALLTMLGVGAVRRPRG